jgi:hypothetical protein
VSLGVWAGYRGYGIGISKQLGGEGSTFSFGAMGGSFGINLRISTYRCHTPYVAYSFASVGEVSAGGEKVPLDDPVRVRSLFLDGYYMFNGKHFSYAAAYDQSLIQRRSAGSLAAGVMYYHSSVAYDEDSCWPLILMMRGIGKMKFTQANVGVGYAYNWVPVRGLLVNVMAMPMLTFVNKLKAYAYATNVEELMEDPYFWDPDVSDEEWDKWFYDSLRIKPLGDQTYNSGISIGFDARMSVTYNLGRYFINAYGQFNNIRYHHNSTHGYLNDWFINASIGIRL